MTTYVLDDEIRHGHYIEDGAITLQLTPFEDTNPRDAREVMVDIIESYERDIDSREELPMYADLSDYGELYIRDPQGGEYVMWAPEEWTAPDPAVDDWRDWRQNRLDPEVSMLNEDCIYAVFNAIKFAYEEPEKARELWERTQIETA